jgi:hypothetical protein
MASYDQIMNTSADIFQEMSRILLVIMYALLTGAVKGYHVVKDKYLEYKYASDDIKPTRQYFLAEDGEEHSVLSNDRVVPEDWVYIEEWIDIKGHKKMVVKYENDKIPLEWEVSPFDLPSAKCPWVWVGDKETEIDLTRTFDKFLVPGNILKHTLVSRLIMITDRTNLIYIETKTFNQVKFPGAGITIEADVDPTE